MVLGGLVLSSWPAAAEQADGWLERPTLSGDWGGTRCRLEDRGIGVWAGYRAGLWSVLGGGFDTGTRYEGFAEWGFDADLERLAGWRGGSFHMSWFSYHGGQPSTDLVGAFPLTFLSGNEADDAIRFYRIYLEQELLGDRVRLKLGQLAADDDFFVSRYSDALVNASFGTFGLGGNQQIAPFYPLAAPGAYAFAELFERWFTRLGVYTADPGEETSSNIGFDWELDEGLFALLEVATERAPLGRTGTYTLGAVGTTADITDFESGREVDGSYAFYAMLDQALILDAEGAPRLGAFVRVQLAAQESRSTLQWYLDGGLAFYSPLPGRDDDVLAIGVTYIEFGDDYVDSQRAAGVKLSRSQFLVELSYRLQVTGWLTLQASVQLFEDAHFSRRDTTAIGIGASVDF
jgi:porin